MKELPPGYGGQHHGDITRAKETDKENYEARLRNNSEVIHVEDYVYLLIEREDPNEHLQKVGPIA